VYLNTTTTRCTAPIYAQSGGATVSTNFTVKPGSSVTVSSLTLNPTASPAEAVRPGP
jgi:hypothetical protein